MRKTNSYINPYCSKRNVLNNHKYRNYEKKIRFKVV